MEIGGIDILLSALPDVPVAEVILRRAREMWSNALFEDAESEGPEKWPLDDERVWRFGTQCREFFVFRDAAAAACWDRDGAVPANRNSMLHFLIPGGQRRSNTWQEITVVIDDRTIEMQRFLDDLSESFHLPYPKEKEAAPRLPEKAA